MAYRFAAIAHRIAARTILPRYAESEAGVPFRSSSVKSWKFDTGLPPSKDLSYYTNDVRFES